jgi:hypothetical protein
MDTTTEITAGCRNCPGETGWGRKEESACGARNLMPPFPGPRVYGTDPRRQGCVAGEILQKQEHFCSHRVAPLTAPVPFRKTRCTTAERGPIQRRRTPAGAGLDVWPKSGQQGTGAPAPATPHAKKSKLSLDGRRPSHGSRDRKGALSPDNNFAQALARQEELHRFELPEQFLQIAVVEHLARCPNLAF